MNKKKTNSCKQTQSQRTKSSSCYSNENQKQIQENIYSIKKQKPSIKCELVSSTNPQINYQPHQQDEDDEYFSDLTIDKIYSITTKKGSLNISNQSELQSNVSSQKATIQDEYLIQHQHQRKQSIDPSTKKVQSFLKYTLRNTFSQFGTNHNQNKRYLVHESTSKTVDNSYGMALSPKQDNMLNIQKLCDENNIFSGQRNRIQNQNSIELVNILNDKIKVKDILNGKDLVQDIVNEKYQIEKEMCEQDNLIEKNKMTEKNKINEQNDGIEKEQQYFLVKRDFKISTQALSFQNSTSNLSYEGFDSKNIQPKRKLSFYSGNSQNKNLNRSQDEDFLASYVKKNFVPKLRMSCQSSNQSKRTISSSQSANRFRTSHTNEQSNSNQLEQFNKISTEYSTDKQTTQNQYQLKNETDNQCEYKQNEQNQKYDQQCDKQPVKLDQQDQIKCDKVQYDNIQNPQQVQTNKQQQIVKQQDEKNQYEKKQQCDIQQNQAANDNKQVSDLQQNQSISKQTVQIKEFELCVPKEKPRIQSTRDLCQLKNYQKLLNTNSPFSTFYVSQQTKNMSKENMYLSQKKVERSLNSSNGQKDHSIETDRKILQSELSNREKVETQINPNHQNRQFQINKQTFQKNPFFYQSVKNNPSLINYVETSTPIVRQQAQQKDTNTKFTLDQMIDRQKSHSVESLSSFNQNSFKAQKPLLESIYNNKQENTQNILQEYDLNSKYHQYNNQDTKCLKGIKKIKNVQPIVLPLMPSDLKQKDQQTNSINIQSLTRLSNRENYTKILKNQFKRTLNISNSNNENNRSSDQLQSQLNILTPVKQLKMIYQPFQITLKNLHKNECNINFYG